MTQTGKAVALISSFGAVGGVGAYAGGLFESKKEEIKEGKSITLVATVSSKLKDEGYLALDTTKDDNWQEVLDLYKLETTKNNLFSRAKEEIKSIQELKAECAKILDKDSKTDTNYKLAKQWCVKKENIETVLGRLNLKLLKFDDAEDVNEKPIWTERIKKLKNNPQKFSAVKITEPESTTGDNIKAFKAGCKALNSLTMFTTSDEFAKNLKLAKEWCSTNTQ